MKSSILRKLAIAFVVVVGLSAVLPASAARAARPPSTPQPPTPISGL